MLCFIMCYQLSLVCFITYWYFNSCPPVYFHEEVRYFKQPTMHHSNSSENLALTVIFSQLHSPVLRNARDWSTPLLHGIAAAAPLKVPESVMGWMTFPHLPPNNSVPLRRLPIVMLLKHCTRCFIVIDRPTSWTVGVFGTYGIGLVDRIRFVSCSVISREEFKIRWKHIWIYTKLLTLYCSRVYWMSLCKLKLEHHNCYV